MYRVLIVDDEPFVRAGLRSVIDWEAQGFSVCGEGVNGTDGLSQIEKSKPDMVLADVRMPGLRGVQMIEEAQARGFEGKFIILTGFSDFKDAQSAIRLGVESFLLKPVEESELIGLLQKIRKELDSRSRSIQLLEQARQPLQRKLLTDLFAAEGGAVRPDDLALCGLDMDFPCFQVAMLVCLSDNGQEIRTAQDFFAGAGNVHAVLLRDQLAVLLKGYGRRQRDALFASFFASVSPEKAARFFAGVGRSVDLYEKIASSYADARHIVQNYFTYKKAEPVVSYEDVPHAREDRPETPIDLLAYFDRFSASIEQGDINALCAAFDQFEAACRSVELAQERATAVFSNIFLKLKTEILAAYPNLAAQLPGDGEIIGSITSRRTLYDLTEYMKQEMTNILRLQSERAGCSVVRRMTAYIESKYACDLKLERLAELFGYNSAYLGKLFKSGVGCTFNCYLDQVRIRHAKLLLTTTRKKVQEVAAAVGYEDIDYFHRKFRMYVGLSPRQYAKKTPEAPPAAQAAPAPSPREKENGL